MWWTRAVRQANALRRVRSSRVVLIPRRWDQALSMMVDKAMGANKPGTPGRARSSRSNHCAGNAGVISAYLCWPACAFFVLHARQWVRSCTRHSLHPRLSRVATGKTRTTLRRGNEDVRPIVIARSAATKRSIAPHACKQRDGLLRRFAPRNDGGLLRCRKRWRDGFRVRAKWRAPE